MVCLLFRVVFFFSFFLLKGVISGENLCFLFQMETFVRANYLQMALVLVTILISAIPVTYCYPVTFQDLHLSGGERCVALVLLFATARDLFLLNRSNSSEICFCLVFFAGNRTSIKFLAIGDWGGIPYPPYITAVQKATAKEMSKVAEQMGADFILALGDNFYYVGVDSVDSPRFKVSRWRPEGGGICRLSAG